MGPNAPKLCARCRRDVLPQLAQPSWHREKHRAPAAEREASPEAQKVKRRKEARKLRKITRAQGFMAAARFFFEIKGVPQPKAAPALVPNDDCPECLKLQAAASAKSAAA